VKTYAGSFSGGEVTPEFFGQIADAKYQTGLALCRNFRILPHGPAQNRAGSYFVREVKDSTKRVRLLPFEFSTTQTMALEMGAGYVRYHTQGATLLSGLVPYETVNTYAEADLAALNFVQSADVLTLVHVNRPPAELRRLGALNWTLTPIVFATTLLPPTGVGAVATPGSPPGTPTAHDYVVTSLSGVNQGESLISAVATCSNNMFDTGALNTITWSNASGATRYNVYKKSNGLWGYVGQTSIAVFIGPPPLTSTFVDDNITPDLGRTPPEANDPFVVAGNYPGAVSYFDQRRVFAGTLNQPQTVWLTRSGTESDMTYGIPSKDDDAIEFRVVARQANTVRHLVPINNLLALTSSAEWRITSVNNDAITPTSIDVKPQSFIGAALAPPVIVNNNVIYAAARGGHVRELAYQFQAGGFVTGDLSLRAPHLFDGLDIVDMAFSKAPYPTVWCVSSNGKLLGLTYVPEQQIGAWHQHDTDGLFESICVVAEGAEDVLYAIVRRTIGGVQKRYVERMAPRAFATQADAYFVDCGSTYRGAPTATISGLTWLEGKTVSILADGGVHRQLVVTAGAITLDQPASVVHVGLPITADLQTLPITMGRAAGFGQGSQKNLNKVYLRVFESSGIFTGPSLDRLTEAKLRTNEPYGVPTRLHTGIIEVTNKAAWDDDGQAFVRQVDPLPLTVTALIVDFAR